MTNENNPNESREAGVENNDVGTRESNAGRADNNEREVGFTFHTRVQMDNGNGTNEMQLTEESSTTVLTETNNCAESNEVYPYVGGLESVVPIEVATEAIVDQSEVDGVNPQIVVTVPATVTDIARNSSRIGCRRFITRRRRNIITRVHRMQHKHGQWTCFFCCHVTTGTVIIGAWDVLLNLLALSLLIFAAIYPELLTGITTGNNNQRNSRPRPKPYWHNVVNDVQAVNCTSYPCTMTNSAPGGGSDRLPLKPQMAPDFPLAVGQRFVIHHINSEGVNVSVLITLCTLLVTLLLLYGVHRKQPSHLMPFFFLQVLDFCISSMTMVSYISYLPNLRQTLQDSPPFPFKKMLLEMQTNCLSFVILMVFISVFIAKMYCINIVWRCYKYLLVCRISADNGLDSTQDSTNTAGQQSQAARGTSAGNRLTSSNAAPEHCMQWLLQHEMRSKMSGAYPEPPPSYDMAMASYGGDGRGGEEVREGAVLPLYTPNPAGGEAPTILPNDDDSPLLPRYEDAIRQQPTGSVVTQ